jgi:hypothetical protein
MRNWRIVRKRVSALEKVCLYIQGGYFHLREVSLHLQGASL